MFISIEKTSCESILCKYTSNEHFKMKAATTLIKWIANLYKPPQKYMSSPTLSKLISLRAAVQYLIGV